MWDQLKPADIQRAKQKLVELRSITLKKHEEELKQLDADEAEIETLAQLAETITAKYLNGEPHSEQRTPSADEPKDLGGAVVQSRRRNQFSPNFSTTEPARTGRSRSANALLLSKLTALTSRNQLEVVAISQRRS